MQYAFSYFYYLKETTHSLSIGVLFAEIDVDDNGVWSDREIRHFLTKIHDSTILLSDLMEFESAAKKWFKIFTQMLKLYN